MSAEDINTKSCNSRGDVVSWDRLLEQGASVWSNGTFPSCTGST